MKKLITSVMGMITFLVSSCDQASLPAPVLTVWPVENIDFNAPAKKYVMLVIDASGSMESDMEYAKSALNTYIKSLPQDVEIGAVAFSAGGIETLADISHDRSSLLVRISELEPGGGTPLAEAVSDAYNKLATKADDPQSFCQYYLVVVTDGAADDGSLLTTQVNQILQTPVRIHTIGFNIDSHHVLNMPGKTKYVSANGTEELIKELTQVLAEKPE